MDLLVKVLLSSGICFSIFSSLANVSPLAYGVRISSKVGATAAQGDCFCLLVAADRIWRECGRVLLFSCFQLAPTDSRLRPDSRAMENGDLGESWNKQTEFRRPLMQSWWVILSNCVLYFRFGWQGESATRRKAKSGEKGKSEAKWGVESHVSVTISRVWRHIR